MSYRRSAVYRFRGLLVLAVFCISIFFLTSSHRASTQSADDFPSIIQWIKDGGYEILLPTTLDVKRSRGTSTATRAANLATHINAGAGTGTADKPPATTTKTLESSSTSRDDGDEAVYLLEEPNPHQKPMDPLEREFFSWRGDEYEMKKKPAPKPPRQPGQPIPDPFPLLSQKSPAEVRRMLQVPDINRPPKPHVPEDTPLLIGFTRNWPQLLQCVSSYITAGWPPEDIYVVENTGVMFSNRDNLLSLQNPFYMNHTQLQMLGVNVIVAPTLLTFAQLQNFYAWTALERNWTDFFWSHQDVVAFSFEKEFRPHTDGSNDISNYSLYTRAVAILRYLRQPAIPKWAHHFFAYDHLTLVHRDAILDVGGWDTHIPFYATDCDMYDRLQWAGYFQGSTQVGIIIDTSTTLDNIAAFFRLPGVHATFAGDPDAEQDEDENEDEDRKRAGEEQETLEGMETGGSEAQRKKLVDEKGETVEHLVDIAYRMQAVKYIDGGWWRNLWQLRQGGGEGEPFYRDPEGFQVGLDMMIETGRRVFSEKYGHRGCDIAFIGIKGEDAWRLERDWDPQTEGSGSEGPYW
ncbi:hypothetical protein VSDG_09666 [Cytospora chrysosperma]|uniref:Nucleotide-diphospho-sugar transferase domain-containing protein n=1 Tax=Cytospora chrysosperma TaxID=252740 RepID=A0A423V9X4_CYTCH|nr:hypothetical protein VSDG_09666 [Valsa sordida]